MNCVTVSTCGRDMHCLYRVHWNANPTVLYVTEPVCSVRRACILLMRLKPSSVSSLLLRQWGTTRVSLEGAFSRVSVSLPRNSRVPPCGNCSGSRRSSRVLVTLTAVLHRDQFLRFLKVVSWKPPVSLSFVFNRIFLLCVWKMFAHRYLFFFFFQLVWEENMLDLSLQQKKSPMYFWIRNSLF